MHADDRQAEKRAAADPATESGARARHEQGRAAQDRAGHYGGHDIGRVPFQDPRRPVAAHADIMHQGHAQADHQAAADRMARGPDILARRRTDREAQGRTDDGQEERTHGREFRVADRKSSLEGQHGDEVRGPDPRAGDQARHGQPGPTLPRREGRNLRVQEERHQGGREADQRGEDDHAPIVLGRNAQPNIEHRAPFPSF